MEALASDGRDRGGVTRDGRGVWCCLVQAVTRQLRSRRRRSRLAGPRAIEASDADRVRAAG